MRLCRELVLGILHFDQFFFIKHRTLNIHPDVVEGSVASGHDSPHSECPFIQNRDGVLNTCRELGNREWLRLNSWEKQMRFAFPDHLLQDGGHLL